MSHDPLAVYWLHTLTYPEDGLPGTKFLVPFERRRWLIASPITSSELWGAGELGFLLAQSINRPHKPHLGYVWKKVSFLPTLSFSSYIYPRLALNSQCRQEWPWLTINDLIFLPLSIECWDSTMADQCVAEDWIQVRSLFMLGKHPTNWASPPALQLTVSETGSHCVILAHLELIMLTQLASNSHRSGCLCLLHAGVKGVCHLDQPQCLLCWLIHTGVIFCFPYSLALTFLCCIYSLKVIHS